MIPIDPEGLGSVGVVGAGTMGAGIAQVFLGAGYRVHLQDVSEEQLDRALERITGGLRKWEEKGRVASAEDGLGRLHRHQDILSLQSCGWVVEAIVEDRSAKGELFRTLGRLCRPDAVLSSNTSSISLTYLGRESGRPERTIGMHFFNPPPVMRLVEVVCGLGTAPETTDAAKALAEALGKTPVVAKDRPGFLSNRILAPMLNEAIWALEGGVGTEEDIDQVMRLGMNHPMGPLELADFIGLDVLHAILEVLHRELGDPKFHPCPLLTKYVEAGRLGRKTGRGFFEYPSG